MDKRMTDGEAKEAAWVVVIAMILAMFAILFAIIKPAFGEEAEKVVANSFIVSGYGEGEFAIKSEPEKTLNAGIVDVKALAKTKKGDLQIQFVVIGSADVTGSSVSNDELASKRAEQVKSVLSANFPEAKIVSWSKGDAENAKQVRVNYKIITKPAPAPTPIPAPAPVAPASKTHWIRVSIVIVVILSFFAVVFYFFIIRPENGLSVVKTAPEKELKRWIEGEMENGRKYAVPITFERGRFYSPFKTLEDPTKSLYRVDFQGIKKAVKGCMSDTRYATQKNDLIKSGVIEIK